MAETSDVRQENTAKIKRLLYSGKEYTKLDITRMTGLSQGTCNTLLNQLESSGEVICRQERIRNTGRSSSVYRMNEEYRFYLCVIFDVKDGVKSLCLSVVTPLGNIRYSEKIQFETIMPNDIISTVVRFLSDYPAISKIVFGVPGIVKDGVITHCDIAELDGTNIPTLMMTETALPILTGNDMHLKAYGYYCSENKSDSIVTIAFFPENILPGTASIHRGEVICGSTGLAGMTAFLPFGFDMKKQLSMMNHRDCMPIIVGNLASIITMINPGKIILTGGLITAEKIPEIRIMCEKYIPKEHMPEFIFEPDPDKYYVYGMYRRAIQEEIDDWMGKDDVVTGLQ